MILLSLQQLIARVHHSGIHHLIDLALQLEDPLIDQIHESGLRIVNLRLDQLAQTLSLMLQRIVHLSGKVIFSQFYLRIDAIANCLRSVLNFQINDSGQIVLTVVDLLVYGLLQLNLSILHQIIKLVR